MNLSGMKQVVKFLLNNFPRSFLIRLSIALRPLFNFFLSGQKFIDPINERSYSKFFPYGYNNPRKNALSLGTLSLERHRLLWLYLKKETNFFNEESSILHVAPEQCFYSNFKSHFKKYITFDLESPLADIKGDICNLPFNDNQFDYILCNHVLEHVYDDQMAMNEIFRVLRKGGIAILQVPIDYNKEKTLDGRDIDDKKLRNKLTDYDVEFAMRYQNPSIESVIDKMLLKNPDEIIVLPLFPHYAAATTGSVYEEISRIISKKWVVPKITFINQFYDNEKFIDAWVEKANKFDINEYDKIIFSYHGIPNSHVDNVYQNSICSDHDCELKITDNNKFCYKATTYETTKILANRLNISSDKYIVTFQSRLTNKWLTPFTDSVLEAMPKEGNKKILVFSPAFTADCLETIIEIGDEYTELFLEAGGEQLDYVESLNYSDSWTNAIIDIIK